MGQKTTSQQQSSAAAPTRRDYAPRPFGAPRLRIGPPGDAHEREAERVGQDLAGGAGPHAVQPMVTPSAGTLPAPASFEQGVEAARGQGTPLPEALQAELGPAVGADLSQVRVHADDRADRLSRAVDARAFTTGSDIFFARGEYAPSTPEGRQVLGHELAHTAQQDGAEGAVQRMEEKAKGKRLVDKKVEDGGGTAKLTEANDSADQGGDSWQMVPLDEIPDELPFQEFKDPSIAKQVVQGGKKLYNKASEAKEKVKKKVKAQGAKVAAKVAPGRVKEIERGTDTVSDDNLGLIRSAKLAEKPHVLAALGEGPQRSESKAGKIAETLVDAVGDASTIAEQASKVSNLGLIGDVSGVATGVGKSIKTWKRGKQAGKLMKKPVEEQGLTEPLSNLDDQEEARALTKEDRRQMRYLATGAEVGKTLNKAVSAGAGLAVDAVGGSIASPFVSKAVEGGGGLLVDKVVDAKATKLAGQVQGSYQGGSKDVREVLGRQVELQSGDKNAGNFLKLDDQEATKELLSGGDPYKVLGPELRYEHEQMMQEQDEEPEYWEDLPEEAQETTGEPPTPEQVIELLKRNQAKLSGY